jgi:dTMP kinase
MKMKRGKLVIIEGTDASGKETQTARLYNNLLNAKFSVYRSSFPRYDTPSGKIVGGPFLGKPEICDSYFDMPSELDPKASSLLYVFDRLCNKPELMKSLYENDFSILDRYIYSNKGMQGGKLPTIEERVKLWGELDYLEHEYAGLPKADIVIFLHMPYLVGMELKSRMNVKKDRVEQDPNYLKNSEQAYLQLAELDNWKKISCTLDGTINTLKSKDEIEKEIWDYMKHFF